jgi:hypothetical protein
MKNQLTTETQGHSLIAPGAQTGEKRRNAFDFLCASVSLWLMVLFFVVFVVHVVANSFSPFSVLSVSSVV